MVGGAARARPRRPSPTTPPTRSRSRSATPATHGRERGALARRAELRAAAASHDRLGPRRGARAPARPRRRSSAAGVGYRLTVSAETLKAVPAARQARRRCTPTSSPATTRSPSTASPPRRSATSSCSLTSVSGVGPKVALAVLSGGAPRELLQGDRRRRREALPGRARDRQADRRADHRRAAREGRRRARARRAAGAGAGGDDPRTLAREGLRRARLHARPRPRSCSTSAERRDARGADRRRAAARRRSAAARGMSDRARSAPHRGASSAAGDRPTPRARWPTPEARRRRRGARPLAAPARRSPTSSTRSR